MRNYFIAAGFIFLLCAGLTWWAGKQREPVQVGANFNPVATTDTVQTLRLTVNSHSVLFNNFGTTTNNTWTGTNTFSAGIVNNATSTGTFGFNITGGCFAINGVCPTPFTGSAASSTLLADANTWSNTGTTTYNGNVAITGNLRVAGNFYAPVNIVASEEFGIVDGTVTNPAVFFNSDPDTGIYRNGTNGLGLAGGGAGATWDGTKLYPNTTDARDLGGSSNVWNRLYLNHASTTNLTVSQSLFVASQKVTGNHAFALTFATTTTWTGTSSPISSFGDGGTYNMTVPGVLDRIACDTNAGTLTVRATDGSSNAYVIASTTMGYSTFPLTFAAFAQLQFTAGNAASSPTNVPCTVNWHEL